MSKMIQTRLNSVLFSLVHFPAHLTCVSVSKYKINKGNDERFRYMENQRSYFSNQTKVAFTKENL